jgi:Flp pilus assembly protein TadD
MKQNYDQAISDYSKAIGLNPKEADYYLDGSLVYEKRGEKVKAEEGQKMPEKLRDPRL